LTAGHLHRRTPRIGEAMIKVKYLLQKDESFEKVLKSKVKKLVDGGKKKYRISLA
jgi:hypothetical protein